MLLSHEIISKFAKLNTPKETNKKESTVYGTAVKYNGEMYVKIDGSDLLTPMDTTTNLQEGERVTVTIKDHNATVNGNITNPSASNSEVVEVAGEVETVSGQVLDVQGDVSNIKIEIRPESIVQKVSPTFYTKTEMNTTITQMYNEIETKVTNDDVKTIVTQNAESWNLSINGKLKGTNYNFTGDSFSIGTTNGNDKACHTPTYSRWNHSDGSYTQVSSKGLEHLSDGYAQPYHYMFDVVVVDGNGKCDGTWFKVQLPAVFKGKRFQLSWQMGNGSVPLNKVWAGHQVDVRNIDYTNATCEVSITIFTKSQFSGGASADVSAYGWAKLFIIY